MYNKATMLRKSYARLGRIAYKAVTPFMRLYLTDKHLRVRILLVNELNEVLLVRSWFGHQKWSLPGGGIKHHEDPLQTAVRELREETGLHIAPVHVHELGTFPNPYSQAPFTVACYWAKMAKKEPYLARRRRLEMLDVAWFPIDALPRDANPSIAIALKLYRKK